MSIRKSGSNKMNSGQNLPPAEEKRATVTAMFDRIAPRYDLVNRLMTFRLDVKWRRKSIQALGLPDQSIILDIACGTGDFCRDLQKENFNSFGIDLSKGMLSSARTSSPLVNADALTLPIGDNSIDGVTCGFALRNFTSLPPFFKELERVLRSGGRIALLEVDQPANKILRFGHKIHFGKIVPLIGSLLSDSTAYRYLPESVSYLPAFEDLTSMLSTAGFIEVKKVKLTGGVAQVISATKP